jgi:hypothetical protein
MRAMPTVKQRRRRQCSTCSWKVSANPFDIPNGYDLDKHCGLKNTIAQGNNLASNTLRLMACHMSKVGREVPCVGWLHHQLTEGENLLLRLAVIRGKVSGEYELDGEQHLTFEDTLPKKGGGNGTAV